MKKNTIDIKAFLFSKDIFCFLAASLLICTFCIASTLFTKNSIRKTDAHMVSNNGKYALIIDPGHGGEDGGCSGKNGAVEKDLNLEISLTLEEILKISGVEVILTRKEDVLLYDKNSDYHGKKKIQDLSSRLKISKDNPEFDFLSIHMNAFPEEKWTGLQVWYSVNNEKSIVMAEKIQRNTEKYLQTNNKRKIKPAGKSIYLLDRAISPAVLVECGFLSNSEECNDLSDKRYQQKLCFIIAYSYLEASLYKNCAKD